MDGDDPFEAKVGAQELAKLRGLWRVGRANTDQVESTVPPMRREIKPMPFSPLINLKENGPCLGLINPVDSSPFHSLLDFYQNGFKLSCAERHSVDLD